MIEGQVGRYRFLALLGKGAFAEVYRAHDEGLGRDVAIKVLHPHVAGEPNAGARIAREARASAALSHPNIAVIHEVADLDGRPSIVMELVEGRPLSEVIPPEGLPPERVARWGAQIADALAHAHERGIIHRDLKGSNIVVTPDGRPKILDFGLARADRSAEAGGAGAGRADFDLTLTETGVLSGTPSFMAPELLRGARADARSDLWALGVLLYQMATGALPFGGSTTAETSAAILTSAPRPLPLNLPLELRATIERCLEKDPARRFASAGEVRAALEPLAREHGAGARASSADGARWLLIAAAVVLIAGLAWLAPRWASRPEVARPEPRQRQLTSNPDGDPVAMGFLSPDGTYLAYSDPQGTYLRTVESGDARALELPRDYSPALLASWMDWFPDGKRLLLSGPTTQGTPTIWSVPIAGGEARKVVNDGAQGVVSPDGNSIAFVRGSTSGPELWVSASDGTSARRLLTTDSTGTLAFYSAAWAPGGRRIAYARRAIRPNGKPFVLLQSTDLAGAQRTILADSLAERLHPVTALAWMPDGRLVFALREPEPNRGDMNLWSLHVDPVRGAPSGRPRQVTHLVRVSYPLVGTPTRDGKQMAVTMLQYPTDIYVGEIPRPGAALANVRRVTLDNRDDDGPAWTPDSRSILFHSDRNGTLDVFEQDVDSARAVAVASGPGSQFSPRASSDGKWLFYWDSPSDAELFGRSTRLMRLPASGGPATEVLRASAAGIRFAGVGKPGVLLENRGDSLSLSEFDADHGRGVALARLRLPNLSAWELNHDGTRIVFSAYADSIPRLWIYDLTRKALSTVSVDDGIDIQGVAWDSRSDGWYCFGASGDGWHVDYVHADGRVDRILPLLPWMRGLAVSPDGRRLAFARNTVQSNSWLLEGI